MKHRNPTTRRAGPLLLAIAAALPAVVQAAPAARVDFATGNARVQGPGGATRPAVKGVEVGPGDTVDTRDGRVQLRFVDGAYVSLQPQSQFRIDEFRFNGQPDGTEKGFFSLLKGGLRTITGLVGRVNKSAYQVTTTVATIGIRGTEYTLQYGSSVTGSVGEGEIVVCNAGGCLNVGSGESYLVTSPDLKPRLTDRKTDLPPPQPPTTPTGFAQGENRDASGDPAFGALITGTLILPRTVLAPGSLGVGTGVYSMTFDAGGDARSIEICPDGCGVVDWSGPVLERGNDGIVAWGRWTGGTTTGFATLDLRDGRSLHYVAGLPVSSTDLAAMKTARMTAEYQLVGATAPTTAAGQAGTLTSAYLSADFHASAVKAGVTVSIAGQTISGTGTGSISSAGTFAGFSTSTDQQARAAGVTGSLSFDGFFAGTSARRAGLGYTLSTSDITVGGTAAFTQVSTGVSASPPPPNP